MRLKSTHTPRKTGIVRDPRYAGHCMGLGEPECPERLEILYAMLQELTPGGRFEDITPRAATHEELAPVHSRDYIRRLESTSGAASTYLDPDTRTSPLSNEAALLAAGGLCQAIAAVVEGRVDNAFALIRPPGHHAERAAAKGFCLYNNVAVGAHYARRSLGLERIAIVDWDLHHGNGTQHCFEDDRSVLFFSTHRAFTFPQTGRLKDVGTGEAKGYTVNLPLLAGLGDAEYLTLFEEILKPVALEFHPDLILVSAGFDLHVNDPMGGMRVTPDGFAGLTRCLLDIADQCCGGKLVMALEGGYDLTGLRDSVREVLREMAGLRTSDIAAMRAGADRRKIDDVLWRIRQIHRKYWKSLAAPVAAPSLGKRVRAAAARLAAYFNS